MKKIIVTSAVIIALIIAFIIKSVYDAGEFKKIIPFSRYSCNQIGTIPGPEDIVMDYSKGIAYISSDDRRAFAKGNKINGSIFIYDVNHKTLKRMGSNFAFEFHPHGIDLLTVKNKQFLYSINHRSNGQFIEKFEIKGDTLHHIKSIENQALMFSPNDLVMLSEDVFYVTNDHGNRTAFGRSLEDYLQLSRSYVLLYDGSAFSIKVKNIKYANGIALSPDNKKLFVASPVGRCIKVYTIEKDYNIKLLYTIECNTGVDNIAFDNKGILWAGCHPKLLTFVRHSLNEDVLAPSEIIKITFNNDSYKKETVIYDDGSLIQSSTVAVCYNNNLLVGSVFDTHILDCKVQ